jgi:hypothetical protein
VLSTVPRHEAAKSPALISKHSAGPRQVPGPSSLEGYPSPHRPEENSQSSGHESFARAGDDAVEGNEEGMMRLARHPWVPQVLAARSPGCMTQEPCTHNDHALSAEAAPLSPVLPRAVTCEERLGAAQMAALL